MDVFGATDGNLSKLIFISKAMTLNLVIKEFDNFKFNTLMPRPETGAPVCMHFSAFARGFIANYTLRAQLKST